MKNYFIEMLRALEAIENEMNENEKRMSALLDSENFSNTAFELLETRGDSLYKRLYDTERELANKLVAFSKNVLTLKEAILIIDKRRNNLLNIINNMA